MSDFTLTTEQVEDGFAHEPEYEYHNPIGYGAHVQGNRRAFRRWLAEVERAAAANAIENLADHVGPEFFKDAGQVASLPDVRQWLRSCAETYRREGQQC